MRRLGKSELARYIAIRSELEDAKAALYTAVDAYNRIATEAFVRVTSAVERVNAQLSVAEDFRQEVAFAISMHLDERSDSWKESERGAAVQDWFESWDQESFAEIVVHQPEDVELEFEGPALIEMPRPAVDDTA